MATITTLTNEVRPRGIYYERESGVLATGQRFLS